MEFKILIIILLSAIGLLAMIILAVKMNDGFGPNNVKIFGLTLVLILTAILGASMDGGIQYAFGILASVGGYLFGAKIDAERSPEKIKSESSKQKN